MLFIVLRSMGPPAGVADMRARPKWALILGTTAVTAPFLLITFGEHVVPSGLTAVLISPASLFIALFAPFILPSERSTAARAWACCSASRGVALVVGVESVSTLEEFLGALAMVGAAFFYGLSSFVVKGRYGQLAAVQTSWISVTVAGVMTLPLAIATTPGHTPTLGSTAALVVLGVLGTALAFVIYYELIADDRRRRAPRSSPTSRRASRCSTARSSSTSRSRSPRSPGLVLILGGVAIASRPKRVRGPARRAGRLAARCLTAC